MNGMVIAALNIALAVILGAFGAHAVKARVNPEQLEWWHTATAYFFYHALGLLLIGILARLIPTLSFRWPALFIQIGIVIFCGSLYAMALGAPRWFGASTPIGGLAFILGWLTLAFQVSKA